MDRIAGRTAVVTGAGSGIGRSIALALAGAGANVVVADIEPDRAEAVRDEVRAHGVGSMAVRTDVASLPDVEALAASACRAFGTVEILCNNAGVQFTPFRAVWDTSYADFQWMVGVNMWGVVHGLHAFIPRMRAAPGQKHIVNTSSVSALFKVPGCAAYTMTKFAIDGLSEVIREELASEDIGVTILYPGYVKTAIAASARLRPAAEQVANEMVRPYHTYATAAGGDQSGDATVFEGGAVHLIGAGETTRAIEADTVGPMVLNAIRANRAYCMTHPAPGEGIQLRASALLQGYRPDG